MHIEFNVHKYPDICLFGKDVNNPDLTILGMTKPKKEARNKPGKITLYLSLCDKI